MEHTMFVSRDDVMYHKKAEDDGFSYLVFREDNHWDYDVIVCTSFEEQADGFCCIEDACRMLPFSVLEYYDVPDAEIEKIIKEIFANYK